jgi:hypothetical protein
LIDKKPRVDIYQVINRISDLSRVKNIRITLVHFDQFGNKVTQGGEFVVAKLRMLSSTAQQ